MAKEAYCSNDFDDFIFTVNFVVVENN